MKSVAKFQYSAGVASILIRIFGNNKLWLFQNLVLDEKIIQPTKKIRFNLNTYDEKRGKKIVDSRILGSNFPILGIKFYKRC